MRLDRRRQYVQVVHGLVVAVEVVLHDFHGFELFKTGFLGNLVLTFVGIVFKMAHIGYVAHITHLVAEMSEVAVKDVERYCGACVTEMSVTVDSGTAYIHSHSSFMYWHETFLAA